MILPARAGGWAPLLRIGVAAAACWHLLGNPLSTSGLPSILVGATAAAVALQPRNRVVFAAFTVAVWVSIWQEAPLLGNHWLLLGLVAVAISAAGPAPQPGAVVGAAQAVVLVFYGFAAFAKLNADFFDPVTSCATYYAAEGAASLGWDLTRPTGAVGAGVLVAVALTELAIPALLLVARTRTAGVALAVTFHAILALDHRHQFYDFTSVLVVVFLTFLPAASATSAVAAVRARVRPQLLQGGAAALAVLAGWLGAADVEPDVPFELGYASWQLSALVVVPLAVRAAWRHRATPAERQRVPALAVPVVLLAVLNGLSPYLELKTATAWNMYANLRTVDGDSNHLLVRATLPLRDAHDDLVEVVEADGFLAGYVDRGLLLTAEQLRWFLQTEDAGGTIRIDGREVTFEPGEIPADLGPSVPEVVGRFAAFRAVRPAGAPVPCQDTYLPAT